MPRILNPHSFDPQDNVFYRNNGDGTFTDVTAELGVESHGGRSLQAIFTDFDLDGDLELYVANDLSPNFLYRNNGDGTFTDVSDASWAADFRGSMGACNGRLRWRRGSRPFYEPLDRTGERTIQQHVERGGNNCGNPLESARNTAHPPR